MTKLIRNKSFAILVLMTILGLGFTGDFQLTAVHADTWETVGYIDSVNDLQTQDSIVHQNFALAGSVTNYVDILQNQVYGTTFQFGNMGVDDDTHARLIESSYPTISYSTKTSYTGGTLPSGWSNYQWTFGATYASITGITETDGYFTTSAYDMSSYVGTRAKFSWKNDGNENTEAGEFKVWSYEGSYQEIFASPAGNQGSWDAKTYDRAVVGTSWRLKFNAYTLTGDIESWEGFQVDNIYLQGKVSTNYYKYECVFRFDSVVYSYATERLYIDFDASTSQESLTFYGGVTSNPSTWIGSTSGAEPDTNFDVHDELTGTPFYVKIVDTTQTDTDPGAIAEWLIDRLYLVVTNNDPTNRATPYTPILDDLDNMYARYRKYEIRTYHQDTDGYADIDFVNIAVYHETDHTATGLYFSGHFIQSSHTFSETGTQAQKDSWELDTAGSTYVEDGNNLDVIWRFWIEWECNDVSNIDVWVYLEDEAHFSDLDWYEEIYDSGYNLRDIEIETRLSYVTPAPAITSDDALTVDRGDLNEAFHFTGEIEYYLSDLSPPSDSVDVWVACTIGGYGTNIGPWEDDTLDAGGAFDVTCYADNEVGIETYTVKTVKEGAGYSGTDLVLLDDPTDTYIADRIEIYSILADDDHVGAGTDVTLTYLFRYEYLSQGGVTGTFYTDTTNDLLGYVTGNQWDATINEAFGSYVFDGFTTCSESQHGLTGYVLSGSSETIVFDCVRAIDIEVSDDWCDYGTNQWVQVQFDYESAAYGYVATWSTYPRITGPNGVIQLTQDIGSGWWRGSTGTYSTVARFDYNTNTLNDYIDVDSILSRSKGAFTDYTIWDRILIITTVSDDAQDRLNINGNAEIRVTAYLEYTAGGTHWLGSGDTLYLDDVLMSWDAVNSWFELGSRTHASVGLWSYYVNSSSANEATYGITVVNLNSQDVEVIWDKIVIQTTVSDEADGRLDINGNVEIRVTASLAYTVGGTVWLGDGDTITLDDVGMSWDSINSWWELTRSKASVGMWNYYVNSSSETGYGITALDLNGKNVEVIWDEIEVYWSTQYDPRGDIGVVNWGGFRLRLKYDSHLLNDGTNDAAQINGEVATWSSGALYWYNEVTKSIVGSWNFAVTSASEDTYGITAFDSASAATYDADLIWDAIGTHLWISDGRDNVDDTITVYAWLTYLYDRTNVTDGTILLNGTGMSYSSQIWSLGRTQSIAGLWSYNITSISGNTHGITKIGTAYYNGVDTYTRISDSAALDTNQDFTVSVWFYFNGAGTAGKVYWTIASKNDIGYGTNDPWHFWVVASTSMAGCRFGDGGGLDGNNTELGTGVNVDDSRWHMITLTYDYSENLFSLYLDGVLKSIFDTDTDGSWKCGDNSDDIRTGEWSAYNNHFNGSVSEVYHWSRHLSDIEVYEAYQGIISITNLELSLHMASMDMADGVWYDQAGSHNGAFSSVTFNMTLGEAIYVRPIWDSYTVSFIVDDNRININDNATVYYTVLSDYDGIIYDGTITLNYTTWEQPTVQRQGFTVSSLNGDDTYGITAFSGVIIDPLYEELMFAGSWQERGLAFDGTYFYVGDIGSMTVKMYDSDGNFIKSFGTGLVTYFGHGVATDGTYIWTSDYGTNRMIYQYLISDASLVTSWVLPAPIEGGTKRLTYDGTNLWIHTTTGGHVWIVDTSGNYVGKLVVVTTDQAGICIDNDGYLLFIDYNTRRLYKYNSEGDILANVTFSGIGASGNGRFGMTSDRDDAENEIYIFRHDAGDQIVKYDLEGRGYIIWDRMQVQTTVATSPYIEIDTESTTINVTVFLDYDNTPITGATGTVTLNDELMTWDTDHWYLVVGPYDTFIEFTFYVNSSTDSTYDITAFDLNGQSCLVGTDRVIVVSHYHEDNRVNVDDEVDIYYQLAYESDYFTYNPNGLTLVTGTYDDGSYGDLATVNGVGYDFSEASGSPAFDLQLNFSAGAFQGISLYIYVSNEHGIHGIWLQMWNYTSSSWYDVVPIPHAAGWHWVNYTAYSGQGLGSGGQAIARLYHEDAGVPSFYYYLDYVALHNDLSYMQSGTVTVNGYSVTHLGDGLWTTTVSHDEVGQIFFDNIIVSGNNRGITGVFNQSCPGIVWDRVQVQSYSTSDERDNINDNVDIDTLLWYDFDNELVVDGTVTINGYSAAHQGSGVWRITRTSATVTSVTYNTVAISGDVYGLSLVDQNSQSQEVIWDEIEVYWSTVFDSRDNIGDQNYPCFRLRLKYDNHLLNDGINDAVYINSSVASWYVADSYWYKFYTYDTVDLWNFLVTSASENSYGITAFDSSSAITYDIDIIWDRMNFNVTINYGWTVIGYNVTLSTSGIYEYDSTTWSGTVTYNSTGETIYPSYDTIGLRYFGVSSATDSNYDLTVLTTDYTSCTWDDVIAGCAVDTYWHRDVDYSHMTWAPVTTWKWQVNGTWIDNTYLLHAYSNGSAPEATGGIYGSGNFGGITLGPYTVSWYYVNLTANCEVTLGTRSFDWMVWDAILEVDIMHTLQIVNFGIVPTDDHFWITFQTNLMNASISIWDDAVDSGTLFADNIYHSVYEGMHQITRSTIVDAHNLTICITSTGVQYDRDYTVHDYVWWYNFTYIVVDPPAYDCHIVILDNLFELVPFHTFEVYANDTRIYHDIIKVVDGYGYQIEVKNRFGDTVNSTEFSADFEMVIFVNTYSFKFMNWYAGFLRVNVTRAGVTYSTIIMPTEIIEFNLFEATYLFTVDFLNGTTKFSQEIAVTNSTGYVITGDSLTDVFNLVNSVYAMTNQINITVTTTSNYVLTISVDLININTTIGYQLVQVLLNITNTNSTIYDQTIDLLAYIQNVNSTLFEQTATFIVNVYNNQTSIYDQTITLLANIANIDSDILAQTITLIAKIENVNSTIYSQTLDILTHISNVNVSLYSQTVTLINNVQNMNSTIYTQTLSILSNITNVNATIYSQTVTLMASISNVNATLYNQTVNILTRLTNINTTIYAQGVNVLTQIYNINSTLYAQTVRMLLEIDDVEDLAESIKGLSETIKREVADPPTPLSATDIFTMMMLVVLIFVFLIVVVWGLRALFRDRREGRVAVSAQKGEEIGLEDPIEYE